MGRALIHDLYPVTGALELAGSSDRGDSFGLMGVNDFATNNSKTEVEWQTEPLAGSSIERRNVMMATGHSGRKILSAEAFIFVALIVAVVLRSKERKRKIGGGESNNNVTRWRSNRFHEDMLWPTARSCRRRFLLSRQRPGMSIGSAARATLHGICL